jgi:cytosine/adenosine deaminase-related metal-dependent hydrolase
MSRKNRSISVEELIDTPSKSSTRSVSGNRLLIRGGTVLSMDPRVGNYPAADIYIEGSRIIAVGVNLDGFDAEVIDATGMIVIPGFIDTHRHACQGSLRRLLPNRAECLKSTRLRSIMALQNTTGRRMSTRGLL